MTWFKPETPLSKNIFPQEKYYFFSQELLEKGAFSFQSHDLTKFTITSEKISKPGHYLAIPVDLLDTLNPLESFCLRIRISYIDANRANTVFNYPEIKLSDILNNAIVKYPELITYNLITSGDPAIDYGEKLIILSHGHVLSKFTDHNIIDKIIKAMNDCFLNSKKQIPGEIAVDNGIGLSIKAQIYFSPEMKAHFISKYIGWFEIK